MKLRSFIALIALSVIALPLLGHHAGFFDPNRVVEVSGTVARFEWTNPHAFLFIDIENDNGEVERWTVEGRSPNQLTRTGWTRETIKPGETITVVGRPPRETSRLAETAANFLGAGPVELPDGKTLIFGPIVTSDE